MHDLRHDQEAADAATHARLRMDAADLRTVPQPDLRTPPSPQYGIPTVSDRIDAIEWELRALRDKVDALQARPLAMAEDAWSVGG